MKNFVRLSFIVICCLGPQVVAQQTVSRGSVSNATLKQFVEEDETRKRVQATQHVTRTDWADEAARERDRYRQTPGCDLVPDALETPAIKKACAQHDKEYEEHKCTMDSWLRGVGSKDCKKANQRVFRDIKNELAPGRGMTGVIQPIQ